MVVFYKPIMGQGINFPQLLLTPLPKDNMKNTVRQPAVFISHGTIYEALKSNRLKSDFQEIRNKYLPSPPDAIIIVSGHWETEEIEVTAAKEMYQINEGFPPQFMSGYRTKGNLQLSRVVVKMLKNEGINAELNTKKQLDHGAIIPLLLLFPYDNISVIQVSLQRDLDPQFHNRVANILSPIRRQNVLFIASGGLVHNRSEIIRFGGHEITPDHWAKEFDDYITNQLNDPDGQTSIVDRVISAYGHPLFDQAHPTSEHFLPLVFAAGTGGTPSKIYEAFQWKNLSMSAFIFR